MEVAGYLGPVLEPPLLEDALIRKVQTNTPPQPAQLSSEDLFPGHHDNQLVEIEAQFLGRASSPSNCLALALQSGNRFADRPAGRTQTAGTAGGAGSPAAGCALQAYAGPRRAWGPIQVCLLLRSPLDVTVVSRPGSTRTMGMRGARVAQPFWPAQAWQWPCGSFSDSAAGPNTCFSSRPSLQAEMRQGEQQLRRSIEERERIGRDLHDDIIQSIYAVGLGLEDCRRVVRQSPEQAEPRLAAAIHTLNNTIRSVRGFIAGLEPKVLTGVNSRPPSSRWPLPAATDPPRFKLRWIPPRPTD